MKKSHDQHSSQFYRVKVKGRLDKDWAEWFEDMQISYVDKDTVITGPVKDQAALHGFLARIRDLNLELLTVERLDSNGVEK